MIPSTFPTANPGSLTKLLEVTKLACDQLAPLVKSLYESIGKNQNDTTKLKDDSSVFTIADGLVQQMLQHHLFKNGQPFENVVGEEDGSLINILERPYSVDDLRIPDEFFDTIDIVRDSINVLSTNIDESTYKDLTVFIDPIDGTKEFSSGKGNECTILVGVVKEGKPVAGIVYKPLESGKPAWTAGCQGESLAVGELSMAAEQDTNGFMVTNGSTSPFLDALVDKLEMHYVRSGGAGNKMLAVLEGKGGVYISDRGVSRWDTCGPQAVIEAHGGILARLDKFMETQELVSYTYKKTDTNLDLTPGLPLLTRYNARDKQAVPSTGEPVAIQDVNIIKPYANVCGLLVVGPGFAEKLSSIHQACQQAAAISAPEFN